MSRSAEWGCGDRGAQRSARIVETIHSRRYRMVVSGNPIPVIFAVGAA
jgi:hypothetical protein